MQAKSYGMLNMVKNNANQLQDLDAPQMAYSVRQVSEQTTLSEVTIWRLIKAKKLKARKVGKRILIRHADLEGFLNQQEEITNV